MFDIDDYNVEEPSGQLIELASAGLDEGIDE